MAKRKRKTLPKDFEALLERGDLAELQAIFESCELDARGGYDKRPALAFVDCPDELVRWLVAEGADLNATDKNGDTPLHSRLNYRRGNVGVLLELGADPNKAENRMRPPLYVAVEKYNVTNVRVLLEHGAHVDGPEEAKFTPLEAALAGRSYIEETVEIAELLLEAGAKKTPRMAEFVEEIGKQFEFHRSRYNPESVDAASQALDKLYEIFDATPAPRREIHDGKSPITVQSKTWQKRYEELWELLVPSSGPAATVQGEVIRIAGRIRRELDGNGGVNWDAEYNKMADAFLKCIEQGRPLSAAKLKDAATVVAAAKRKNVDPTPLVQLAVRWVLQNPDPIELPPTPYKR
ncbi:ankyrin repeat domain-containing protein [Thalassoroseus pseudoceratinae]|uniref:ankyrin repeat domain-containing protein n=1 Tax=Thalassoroseus pseudoceratinae TaxID=2713176 RepID=UPI0014226CA5|nr:ankyrin repeat domain-containing protein [Thalassoroseus pseudoceratinae]